MLLGEEISCLNSKGKAIHLCGLGIKEFIPGSIDGAQHGARGAPSLPLSQAIGAIHRQGGVAYAAHPGSTMGFMQRLFLKRGNWGPADFAPRLTPSRQSIAVLIKHGRGQKNFG